LAHILNVRRVQTRLRGSLESELPLTMGANNFAAFCGTPEQRRYSGLRAISRFCGRCGVIILHDDPLLERDIAALPQTLATQDQQHPAFPVHTLSSKNYDPLYGLDEDAIVNLFLPESGSAPDPATQQIRTGLLAYLTVMQASFRQDPRFHGQHPFNLDLLLQLVQMPYQQLESRVLAHLPQQTAELVRPILNQAGMQKDVYSTVLPYATVMSKYYWTPRGVQGHSRISIVQAVRDRQVICLRIPNSRQALMNYLCADLQMLADLGLPFLLVSSSLELTNSARLRSWFLDAHDQRNYYTGILAKSMSSVADTEEDIGSVFTHYDQILVYRCSNTNQAQPFTRAYGHYNRRQTDRSTQTFFPIPRILPTVGTGKQVRQVSEENIHAEELMDMQNGVFLCGNHYPIPVLIRRFSMTGGDNLGLPLP